MARGAIKLTLEQLRMAARQPRRNRAACNEETLKIIHGLKAADWEKTKVMKYVRDFDECMERHDAEKKRRKTSTQYFLSKYLVQEKNRKK